MAGPTGAGLVQSQEPTATSGTSHEHGGQGLGPSFATFPSSLAESCFASGTAGTRTRAYV